MLTTIRRLVEPPAIEFDDGEGGVVRALELADEGADVADALIHVTMEQFMADRAFTFDRTAAKNFGRELLAAPAEPARR